MIGDPKVAFRIETVKKLIDNAKTVNDLSAVKKYMYDYFMLCSEPHGVYMWRPDICTFKHYSMKDIVVFIRPIKKVFYATPKKPDEKPKIIEEFVLSRWFFANYVVCVPKCDPCKPRLYNIKGQRYLNIFPGYPHEIQNLSEYSTEDHAYAKLIFEHIRDVWCSGNWELTEYILKWFGGMSAGRKMYSLLYLKSGQGWGKGVITDFIQRYVLGTQLVFKTSDPQTILGSFNAQLQGKVLLLLEEMPTERSDWNSLYRSIKDKVTSDVIEIHEKYKTPTDYKNILSTIVLTNENALRVENDDRRTVFLDVSPARKGDLDYFKKLGNAMKRPGVGAIFYSYLRAIDKAYPDFDGNPPPMTDAKREHIVSTLTIIPIYEGWMYFGCCP